MLVVRVELWPQGDSRALRQMDALTIVNVGPASRGRHLYAEAADDTKGIR